MSKGKQREGEAQYEEVIAEIRRAWLGAHGFHDKLGLDRRS